MQIAGIGVVVTGGASGLGGATAQMLAENGARVTIFDLNEEAGRTHAAQIGAEFVPVNVTDPASVSAGFDLAAAMSGATRVLVNCAGIPSAQKTVGRDGEPHSLDLFRRTIEINLIGTFNTLSQFAARLVKAPLVGEERGVVINTASVAAYDGQIGQVAYCASKSGVVGMTLPIARDLAQYAIRIMTVAPGLFLTPMMRGLPQPAQDSLARQVPFPSRLGDPSEYASLVAHIVTNPMLNGEVIRLDGALRMGPR
jgi:NAD(P)-dependent dehydrogenase (short-subunit alcohol dehydrogenase family)